MAEPGPYWPCVEFMLSHYGSSLLSMWWDSFTIGSICKNMAEHINYWSILELLEQILKSVTFPLFLIKQ